jgi:LysM repeat protein
VTGGDRPGAYAPASMRRRSPARFLAPVALVTAAVAVYAVVHQATSKSDGAGTTSTTATTATSTAKARKTGSAKARTYVVKSGDVLSGIAAKQGTTVQELQRLNPSIDAAALHPGQKLKLPR